MKKLLLCSIILLLAITIVHGAQSDSGKLPTDKLIGKMKNYTVQIGVEYVRHFQPYSWTKVERSWPKGKPEECQEDPDLDKCQDYSWEKEEGKWQEEDQKYFCSGHIFYSGENMDVAPGPPHTLIGTNAHCATLFVEDKLENFFGDRMDHKKIYAKEDLKKVGVGNEWKVKKDARPIGEQWVEPKYKKAIIKHRKGQQYTVRAELEAFDYPLDYAVFRLDQVYGLPNASFGETPKVGQEVWIAGAPLTIPFSYDKGRVNQIHLDLREGDVLEVGWLDQCKLSIAAAPGSSGSGIYNENGELVAVLHGAFILRGYGDVQGGQLALDIKNIKEWLRWSGLAYALESTTSPD